MSFNHVIKTAYTQTITILYKYFCIWELNFRLNNINLYYLSLTFVLIFIIIIIIIIIELLNHS